MISRVRRTRPAAPQEQLDLLPMVRVGRTRPSAVPAAKPQVITARVARTPRRAADPYQLPAFVVDWSRSLSWKFSIFMVSSYLYYHMNRCIIADTDYDRLARELLAGYRSFDHIHKKYVTKGMLEAGTAYSIREYPLMVQHAASHMLSVYRQC